MSNTREAAARKRIKELATGSATYIHTRWGRGMGGRGMGTKCDCCGKEAIVKEMIMGKHAGSLCSVHAKEARGIWAGALGVAA